MAVKLINGKGIVYNKSSFLSSTAELKLKRNKNIEIVSEWDPTYKTVYDSFTTPPSSGVANAQEIMVISLVNDGIWAKLDVFYVFAQESNGDGEAQINWKNPGTYDVTLINGPEFTSLEGFLTGASGSEAIETDWRASYGVNYSINNASMFCYPIWADSVFSANTDMGATTSGGGAVRIDSWDGAPNKCYAMANTNGIAENGIYVSNTTKIGLMTISRTASNLQTFYVNSTSKGSSAPTSSAEPTVTVNIGCLNTNYASRIRFNNKVYAFGGMGAGLDGTEVGNLYSALSTYLASI